MNDYLIKSAHAATHQAKNYRCLANTGTQDGEDVLEILHTSSPLLVPMYPVDPEDPDAPSGPMPPEDPRYEDSPYYPPDVMIAQRIEPDAVAEILDEGLYTQVRPFGNNPDGSATGSLLYHHFAGWPTRVFDNGEAHPASNVPFDAEARHKYFDTPDTPASTGWGFRMELIGSYETRDPSARAIGVYSDPECTQYLWTTGAFSLGESDWQVDDEGEPLQVWYTDSWDGDRPGEQKDWHIAFLIGSAQEGHQTLPVGLGGIRYLFWEKNQGDDVGEIPAWVQPQGNYDAYQMGDKVTYNGSTWESTVNDNVWAPGVYGWVVSE